MPEVNPIPEGFERLIAHLVVDGAAQAIDFYKKAFGAEEVSRSPLPGSSKLMHATIRIGESIIMLVDDLPEFGGPPRSPKALGGSPVTLHRQVEDVDAVMERAAAAGATITMPAMDAFWGDRYGKLTDPFGHEWSFATHIKDMTPEETEKAAEEFFGGAKATKAGQAGASS